MGPQLDCDNYNSILDYGSLSVYCADKVKNEK